ncbi:MULTISPECIES: hypothetical protein [Amycolatopsis]|uniref:hypothetical protein n=1 Tax=Amycolatopsis TaxID=1813 RepID=UPI000B8B4467|nr:MULTISPECIES: hypothetical protein [Amycolatopsis]OXM70741.1 hypothetical protein CF166_20600 [Amycolatopsis sp. KNN50.9b]
MSTPEHTPHTGHIGQTTGAPERRGSGEVVAASTATRTTRAVTWAGWHLGELAGVLVPVGLGAVWWEGFYAVSVLTALGWAVHEVRARTGHRGPSTKDRKGPT